jgi:hypothetical protein
MNFCCGSPKGFSLDNYVALGDKMQDETPQNSLLARDAAKTCLANWNYGNCGAIDLLDFLASCTKAPVPSSTNSRSGKMVEMGTRTV